MSKSVLISGAGIAGPSLAMWLARMGYAPTVIERAPALREGGYMIDVWGAGYDILGRMGLLNAARDRGYIMNSLRFLDERGETVSGFDADVFRRALNGRFFSVPRRNLARTIYDAVNGKVETLYSTSIDILHEDETAVSVTFTNGETRRFDLVVGADGLRSHVREIVFGPEEQFEKYLHYYAASFISENYPHRNEGTYVSFAKPGRQISRYAMRDGRSAFLLVFYEKQKLTAHTVQEYEDILHGTFGRDGWEAAEILARMDQAGDLYFDAVSQVRMPHWSKGRVALVGDAAHCPSLLAGAGSAFAMLGAYILAGELKTAAGDHRAAFAAYEDKLRPFIEQQQKTAESFAGAFTPKSRLGIVARDVIVNLMNIPLVGAWITQRFLSNAYALPDYGL